MQHRSISQRLSKAKSTEVKHTVAQDWATSWELEQSNLIQQLGRAVKNNDYDALCVVTGELKAVTQKRFSALPKVLMALK